MLEHNNGNADQTILVVDDEAINRRLLDAHLRKKGYEVLQAGTGKEALEMAAQGPDLILLDIMMPGLDGFETCRRLKQDEALKDIPVIFLSALGDAEDKARGLEAGGVDYVSKPFDSRELLARVRTHLTLRKQERLIRLYADHLEEMVDERTKRLRQAEAELQRDYDMQSVVNTLLRSSLNSISEEELAERTLDLILSIPWLSFQARGCVFLAMEDGRTLRMAAHRNLAPQVLANCRTLQPGECVCGHAATLREIIIVDEDDPIHDRKIDSESHAHLCAPIVQADTLIGVLTIYLHPRHRPEEKELEFLRTVTHTLARLILYKRAVELMQESEERYRTIFESTGTAMVILDDAGLVTLANSEFEALSGHAKEELEGRRHCDRFMHPDDKERILGYHRLLRMNADEVPGITEFRFVNRGGEVRHVALTMSMIPSTSLSVASLADVTDRKRAEEQLLHHAFHDPLTGLPNRTALLDRLERESELAKSSKGYKFAMLLLDLDRFNIINESLGHHVGDMLIRAMAGRLRSHLEPSMFMAAMGGDEFAVVLPDLDDMVQPLRAADNILAVLRLPYDLEGQEIFTTASIGIAYPTEEQERAEDLLRNADTALHRAKLRGKARYEVFDQAMFLKARQLMQTVTDLRLAIERQEFQIFYQPLMDLRQGRLEGSEALIRWRHPSRGLVSPIEFIPISEETGLIIPMGRWVLEAACTQMQDLARELSLPACPRVAVNISGKQFAQEDLFERVVSILDKTGFDPARLKLEITESAIMENAENAARVLERLKTLNLHIAIDDFGTGYSSLSYLSRFPVDLLKVDRAFVSRMTAGGENLEIVRTVVTLAHTLGLQVVAEGVETPEDERLLKELGCEFAQGYYYAKPMPLDEYRALVASGKS